MSVVVAMTVTRTLAMFGLGVMIVVPAGGAAAAEAELLEGIRYRILVGRGLLVFDAHDAVDRDGGIDDTASRAELLGEGMCSGGVADAVDASHAHLPVPRVGTPDDIAPTSLFLASDEAGYITGAELVIDGGMTCGYGAGTS